MKRRMRLHDLRFVCDVIDKMTQKQFVGGYKYTDKGYYLFTQSELECLYGNRSNFPDVFGTGSIGCWDADGQKSELFYKVSKNDFDRLFPNGNFYGSVYSQTYAPLDSVLGYLNYDGTKSWSYGGYPNNGYYYDPFDEQGSYHNPYSEKDYQAMLKNSTWQGGFVFGRGYVFPNTTCISTRNNSTVNTTTFGDMFGSSSSLEQWSNTFANAILSNVPGVGLTVSIMQSRISDMMNAIYKDLSKTCNSTSNLIIAIEYPQDNVTAMYYSVYNNATSEKLVYYRMTMTGAYYDEQ